MTRMLSCFTAAVLVAFGAFPASASNDADAKCQSADPAVVIPACTVMIKRSDIAPTDRAMAFARRGMKVRDTDRKAAIRDFTAAIAWYQKLDPRAPNAAERIRLNTSRCYAFRGREYYALFDYERARADFDRAVALDKDAYLPRLLRGALHITLNQPGPAFKELTAAIALDPTGSAEAYSYRGRIHAELGHLQYGLSDLNKAVELAPKNAEYRKFRDQVAQMVQADTQDKLQKETFLDSVAIGPKASLDGGFGRAQVK